jgi:hypothetical protein
VERERARAWPRCAGLIPRGQPIRARSVARHGLTAPSARTVSCCNTGRPSERSTPLSADNHECALIGDTTADVFAGMLAGVPVIGYANKPGKAQALAEVQAAAITDDLSDITHALRDDLPVMGRTAESRLPMIKAAPAAPRPALPAPGSALGGPPGPPAPSHRWQPLTKRYDQQQRSVRLPRFRLSGSRPPRLGRPCGPSHSIGYADPRHGGHSPGFGNDEDDGAAQES